MAIPSTAVTLGEAELAFNALNKVYWDPGTRFFRKEESGDQKTDFWLEAQLWDTVMDQFDSTHSEAAKKQINDLYDSFTTQYPDWTKNKFNDDIMWWTIGCARAYRITGDLRYLQKAKSSFDFVYQAFCDDSLGGGIWWSSDRRSKNSCIECPAIIAAMRLSELLNDSSYFEKARSLYQWQKNMLTDGRGKVFDSVRIASRRNNRFTTNTNSNFGGRRNSSPISTFSLTYNQGTYLGASVLLYLKTKDGSYLTEAIKTADWTRANLCTGDDHILRSENQGDGGAFKGVFVRYMKLLVRDCGCSEYLPWMQSNADTAWRNRRPTDNIMGWDWSVRTGPRIQSQSAASAVALVLTFPSK